MAAAEGQQLIQATTSSLEKYFGDKKGILLKQTTKGCVQECMGCEASSEYKIANMDFSLMETESVVKPEAMQQAEEMYAVEQSGCCMRFFWRDGRAMRLSLSQGGEAGGSPIIEYSKDCGMPLLCMGCHPCCCMLPELTTTVNGEELKSKYVCDAFCCISNFSYSENGAEVYKLRPDTCCLGCLPKCHCEKCKPMTPYFFYDSSGNKITDGNEDPTKQPQIRKLWGGMGQECCTTADNFAVFFPEEADVKRKAGLIGLTFLVDFTVFERQGKDLA